MAEIVKNNVMRACTVMLIVLLDCTLGQITLERHKQVRELCLRDSLLWTDTLPRSVIRCVLECRRTDRCYAITVSTQTSLCSYYDWRLDSEYPLIMGCTASADSDDYIIIPGKVLPKDRHSKTYKNIMCVQRRLSTTCVSVQFGCIVLAV